MIFEYIRVNILFSLILFQVTEKTDAYMDNLRVGLELWEKQLLLGGEVDSWAGAKLALFAEGNPFSDEKQVLAFRVRSQSERKTICYLDFTFSNASGLQDEIHTNEENIEHFHKKSSEIQEMLLSQEAPLELQVNSTDILSLEWFSHFIIVQENLSLFC